MLKSAPVAAEIRGRAEEVASAVRAQAHTAYDEDIAGTAVIVPLPVDVRSYVTDRAASAVVIPHPAGLGHQAKYGVLTRSASAAGLEVTSKR